MKTITYDESKWKLMPIDPTNEMIDRSLYWHRGRYPQMPRENVPGFYAALLAAAPAGPSESNLNANSIAAIKGVALNEEPRVTHVCNMGVGCEEYGVCFAEAHGQPDQCGRPD